MLAPQRGQIASGVKVPDATTIPASARSLATTPNSSRTIFTPTCRLRQCLAWTLTNVLVLALLPGLAMAQPAKPTSPRKWLVTSYQKLAEQARQNPLSAAERSNCEPK
jgi:hypothetical protein